MNLVTAFVACLLILGTQGQPASKSNKCKCYSYIGRISPKLIKAEPMIHYPSIFCPHTEIIVTTKADMKKCVNPESPLGRHILKKSQQAREERSYKHQDCLSEYCCNLNKTLHDVHAALLRHSRSDTWC